MKKALAALALTTTLTFGVGPTVTAMSLRQEQVVMCNFWCRVGKLIGAVFSFFD